MWKNWSKGPNVSLERKVCIATHLCVFRVCVCVVRFFFLIFFCFFQCGWSTYYSLPIHRSTTRNLCCCESARALGPHIFENLKNTIFLWVGSRVLYTHTHTYAQTLAAYKCITIGSSPQSETNLGKRFFGFRLLLLLSFRLCDACGPRK